MSISISGAGNKVYANKIRQKQWQSPFLDWERERERGKRENSKSSL